MAASWAIAVMIILVFIVTTPVAVAFTPVHWHHIERDGRRVFVPYKGRDEKLRAIWFCALSFQVGVVLVFIAFLTRALFVATDEARGEVNAIILPLVTALAVLQITSMVIWRKQKAVANSEHDTRVSSYRH